MALSITRDALAGLSFAEKCYLLLRQVPSGRVTTYKALAEALGTKAYRAVGTAMNKNPYAPEVPCHRVVSTHGGIGGFAFGCEKKITMLNEEGIDVINDKIVDFHEVFFDDFH